MKLPVLALALVAASAWGQGLDQSEREFAMSNLHASRKLFLDSIQGLTQQQWKFKPAPDRWSIQECAEHIVVSEDMIFNMAKQLMAKPAGNRLPDARQKDQQIIDRLLDRSHKAQAPASEQPKGQWTTPEEISREFKQRRDRAIEYVETTKDDLRAHTTDSKNPMDAYQVLLMMSAHTERHVAQINEVKADPRYPK